MTATLDLLLLAIGSVRRRALRSIELATNRRLMRRFGSCGNACQIKGAVTIVAPQGVKFGNNVHLGMNAYIRADGGLSVGDNTHISRNLVLYTCNHNYDGERLPYDEKQTLKPVEIGRNVWIGMNVCIAPGTKIGDGAIIAMGAVVSGEVAPFSIVGGQPLRVLGHRDEEHYHELDRKGAYCGRAGRPLES